MTFTFTPSQNSPRLDPLTEKVQKGDILLASGEWVLQWIIVPLGADELAGVAIQAEQHAAAVVQNVLDTQARSMGYDSIHTAVTYADEARFLSFKPMALHLGSGGRWFGLEPTRFSLK